MVALEVWNDASWYALATRQPQVARDAGALVHLQFALDSWPEPTFWPASRTGDKLGISSRSRLDRVLPGDLDPIQHQ